MDDIQIAIIGGSGISDFDGITIVKRHQVDTPFGAPGSEILEAAIDDPSIEHVVKFYFLSRHGQGHTISPSEVNYRANIFALKMLGAKYIISLSAVGSLKEELTPTMFVLPDQFIDWTKGLRKRTFFTKGMVGHVSVAVPVESGLQDIIADTCKKTGIKYSRGGSYICIEGPQFSSKAESTIFRSFDASVIGMTNVPEAYLAKEAGMAYATIAMVTDYDCWREEHCSVEEIMKVIRINNQSAQKLVLKLIPELVRHPVHYIPENQGILITAEDKLTKKHKAMLDVLLK